TCVFRMSCIYGPRQCGTEDQGWVAHFLISALQDDEITIYGDGKQVRDILFVDDLVDAFLCAERDIDRLAGRAFNVGGGPNNTISLLELVDMIESLDDRPPRVRFDRWRPGDQRYYVSNNSRFSEATGWEPTIDRRTGVERLYDWLEETYDRRERQVRVDGPDQRNAEHAAVWQLRSEGA
ncbi:MAG: NAD-dependent epimerase/dehydratase family protein, partial [Persicimonas sp.]